jgi:DNA-binding phage protein
MLFRNGSLDYVKSYLAANIEYLGNMVAAYNNGDLDLACICCDDIETNTDMAVSENSKYNISPKLQEANSEWLASLNDMSNEAKCMRRVAVDAQHGIANTVSNSAAEKFFQSATEHLKKRNVILEANGLRKATKNSGNVNTQIHTFTDEQVNDQAWLGYIKSHSNANIESIDSIVKAYGYGDFDLVCSCCDDLETDTDLAISENSKYDISPKFQETNSEWIAALHNYNNGAKSMRQMAVDAQHGIANPLTNSEAER